VRLSGIEVHSTNIVIIMLDYELTGCKYEGGIQAVERSEKLLYWTNWWYGRL